MIMQRDLRKMIPMNRRGRACFIFSFVYVILSLDVYAQMDSTAGWQTMPSVLQRIIRPSFPDKNFDITNFGAKGDGAIDCTAAFEKAITACSASGGGRVIVPKGTFLTGAIHLKSHVHLYISRGAVIRFSVDPKKYLPLVYTRWEGTECMNYSPLIYAFEQEDIAVTGEGILDGQGSNEYWWSWKGKKEAGWRDGMPNQLAARKRLMEMAEKNISVVERIFGEGAYLRPNFFEPYQCTNVLLQGVTFRNSPMWFINPVLCKNVSIIGVTIDGLGPNNDGCDPESCTDVLIENCVFNNGDDCIALKSGRNADGRRINVPCENVIIRGCTMKNGHGGVVIGSEVSGGIKNVFAENNIMDSPELDRVLRIKTNAMRGGVIENIFLRNIKVGQVADAIVKIDFYYEEGDSGGFVPTVRNIDVRNINSKKSRFGIWVRAFDRSPVKNIHIEDCVFENVAEANVIENVKDLTLINVQTKQKNNENVK
ncbi:MAG: glycoside hydrolase family 28 protein [Ignavibacteriales bacterium]|nr:glycoside hydrolase family 28 protein [Ignavibacteriales bacterium]